MTHQQTDNLHLLVGCRAFVAYINFFVFLDLLDSKMNFHPIIIQNVLTISKKELEDMVALKRKEKTFSTIGKVVMGLQEAPSNIIYITELKYRKRNGVGIDLSASLALRFNDKIKICANVSFYVKSASHSVKGEDGFDFDFNRKYSHNRRWSGDLCKLTDVLNPEKNFIADGKLTIHMKAILFSKQLYYGYRCEPTLAQMLWKRDDHDFTIAVGKDGGPKTEIKIHKFVLATRSPVFDRMLQTNMKESNESRLEIIDFDVEVVQAAVEFFYDRENFSSLNLEQLINLLHFVDKYDIDGAKGKIQSLLFLHIYPDTVCQLANVSITTNSLELKEACLKTLNLYILGQVKYDHADSIDKDFAAELFQRISMPNEEAAPSDVVVMFN